MFPSATIGRGVHSMVIACVPGSKCETWMFILQVMSLYGRTMSGIGS